MTTRAHDEHILTALDMLRSGMGTTTIARRLDVDHSNLLKKLRKVKEADAQCGENIRGHYGTLK